MAWSRYAPREKLFERAGLAQRQVADATKLLTDMRATAARPWWRKLLGSCPPRGAMFGCAGYWLPPVVIRPAA